MKIFLVGRSEAVWAFGGGWVHFCEKWHALQIFLHALQKKRHALQVTPEVL